MKFFSQIMIPAAMATVLAGCNARKMQSEIDMKQLWLSSYDYQHESGQWPDSVDCPKNPLTGDVPGYEYVKPPADIELEDLKRFVVFYQLRNGRRDTDLDVCYGDGRIGPFVSSAQVERSIIKQVGDRHSEGFALSFDGTDDYVRVPSLRFDGSHPITLEALVSPSSLPRRDQTIVGNVNFAGIGFGLYRVGNWQAFWARGAAGQDGQYAIARSKELATVNRSVHLAAVFDGKESTLFVNGSPTRSASTPTHLPSKFPFFIGADPREGAPAEQFFRGQIDEVRISRTARYSQHFTPTSRFQSDSKTIALYHFDSGRGTVASDSSGNNHHGTIVGAKWVANISGVSTAKDHVDFAFASPSAPNTNTNSEDNLFEFSVDTRDDWRDTGVFVTTGTLIKFSATGEYIFGIPDKRSGPNGLPGATTPHTGRWPANDLTGLALIGRIGKQGEPFVVGESLTMIARGEGQIYLTVNDDVRRINRGSLQVTIQAEGGEIRPALSAVQVAASPQDRPVQVTVPAPADNTPVIVMDAEAVNNMELQQFLTRDTIKVPDAPAFGPSGEILLRWQDQQMRGHHLEPPFSNILPTQKKEERPRWIAGNFNRMPLGVTPVEKVDDFETALAEIRTRWSTYGFSNSGSTTSPSEFDMYASTFDRSLGNALSITDLEQSLNREKPANVIIRALGMFGPEAANAVPKIVDVASRIPNARAECAQALANIGAASTPEIRVLLKEGSPEEKQFAIAVAGMLGRHAESCIPELAALLEDPNSEVADAAFWGLSYLMPDPSSAIAPLLTYIEKKGEINWNCTGAIYRAGSAATETALEILDGDIGVKQAPLVYLLGLIGEANPDAADKLGELLHNPNAVVRTAAVRGCGALAKAGSSNTPALVRMAVQSTPMPKDRTAMRAFAETMQLRIDALDAIARIGRTDAESVKRLAGLLSEPVDPKSPQAAWPARICGHAAFALGALGGDAKLAIPALISVIESPIQEGALPFRQGYDFTLNVKVENYGIGFGGNLTPKLIALQALGNIGYSSAEVLSTVRKCLPDRDPAIRAVATKSLIDLGHPPRDAVDILTNVMHASQSRKPEQHPEWLTLLIASEALVTLGDTALPEILENAQAEKTSSNLLHASLLVLGKLGAGSEDTYRFLTRLSFEQPGMQQATQAIAKYALNALELTEDQRLAALMQLFENGDIPPATIVQSLREYGSQAEAAVSGLIDLLQSEDGNLRLETVYTLRAIAPQDTAVIASLVPLLEDRSRPVKQAAFKTLCEAYPVSAPHVSQLVAFASKNSSAAFGLGPVEDVSLLGGDVVVPILVAKLEADPAYRNLLTALLRDHFRSEKTAKTLASQLSSPDVEVRRTIVNALLLLRAHARGALNELKSAATDEDPMVAWQATLTLVELLPLDEVIASVPVVEESDLEMIVLKQFVTTPWQQRDKKVLEALRAERNKATAGYWLRMLASPDPNQRMYTAIAFFNYYGPTEELLRSVIDDSQTEPQLKKGAEQLLERQLQDQKR